jgi:tRNA(fMet)-specific endonuclease VapC
MMYLLDTNTCIYIINNRPPEVVQKFLQVDIRQIAVSSITVAELRYGAVKSGFGTRNMKALGEFIASLTMKVFDDEASKVYATLRTQLERKGTPIGPLDTLIAAHALSLDVVLVTNNLKEFKRVPKLRLENWV